MIAGGRTWNGKLITHMIVSCLIQHGDCFLMSRTLEVMYKYTWAPDELYIYYFI